MRKEFYNEGELVEQQTYSYDFMYFDNGNIKSIIGKQGELFSGEYLLYYESGKLAKVFNAPFIKSLQIMPTVMPSYTSKKKRDLTFVFNDFVT